jgi:hypothetical protein
MFILFLTALKAFLIERVYHRDIITPVNAKEFASAKRHAALLTTLCVFFNILLIFQIIRNIRLHGFGGRELWVITAICLAIELFYCVWRAGATTLSSRYYDTSDKTLLRRILVVNVLGSAAILYPHALYGLTLILS